MKGTVFQAGRRETALGSKNVKDPTKEDPREWEPIWFE